MQKECQKVSYCQIREENAQDDDTVNCLLEDRVWVLSKDSHEELLTTRRTFYCVNYEPNSKEAVCDCKMFEIHGIMCRHLIRIYDTFHIDAIPQKYVLRRWRKDIPRRHSKIAVAIADPKKIAAAKLMDKMHVAFDPIIELGVKGNKYCDIVLNGLKSIELELLAAVGEEVEINPSQSESNCGVSLQQSISNTEQENNNSGSVAMNSQSSATGLTGQLPMTPTSRPSQISIKDPVIPKKKGRPQSTRFKNICERGFPKKATGRGKRKVSTSMEETEVWTILQLY